VIAGVIVGISAAAIGLSRIGRRDPVTLEADPA
jgi:hypothetical protein